MVVVAKGRLWRSTTARSRPGSPMRIADAPITATGRLAFAIRAWARVMSSLEAAGRAFGLPPPRAGEGGEGAPAPGAQRAGVAQAHRRRPDPRDRALGFCDRGVGPGDVLVGGRGRGFWSPPPAGGGGRGGGSPTRMSKRRPLPTLPR